MARVVTHAFDSARHEWTTAGTLITTPMLTGWPAGTTLTRIVGVAHFQLIGTTGQALTTRIRVVIQTRGAAFTNLQDLTINGQAANVRWVYDALPTADLRGSVGTDDFDFGAVQTAVIDVRGQRLIDGVAPLVHSEDFAPATAAFKRVLVQLRMFGLLPA